jgi:hypothetical protein
MAQQTEQAGSCTGVATLAAPLTLRAVRAAVPQTATTGCLTRRGGSSSNSSSGCIQDSKSWCVAAPVESRVSPSAVPWIHRDGSAAHPDACPVIDSSACVCIISSHGVCVKADAGGAQQQQQQAGVGFHRWTLEPLQHTSLPRVCTHVIQLPRIVQPPTRGGKEAAPSVVSFSFFVCLMMGDVGVVCAGGNKHQPATTRRRFPLLPGKSSWGGWTLVLMAPARGLLSNIINACINTALACNCTQRSNSRRTPALNPGR